MKDLESGKIWFLELIYLECRPPRKDFDKFRSIVHEFVVFSTESFIDDGSETYEDMSDNYKVGSIVH